MALSSRTGGHVPAPDAVTRRSKVVLLPANGRCRVRGTGILNSLHFAHARGGSGAVIDVASRLSEADHVALRGMKRTAWYPFALHCRVLRAVDLELGAGDHTLLFDLGYHSASQDFPRVFRPLMRVGRPGWMLDVATRLWRVFHGEGQWHLERSPHAIIARLEGWAEADEAFCASFVGYVTAALELSGAHDVEGSHPTCKARGAPHCVFTVRWS